MKGSARARLAVCLVAASAFGFATESRAQGEAHPVVRTQAGQVEGTVEKGIAVYKGVPFAEAPVGALRWRAPQLPKPWVGVKKAATYAPACEQISRANPALGIPALPTSEDCLYLNIWSPAKSADERLPVMVWIYGGGFTGGATSIPLYDGTNLARKGVVFVSIAYRLGPFGFLADRELTSESGRSSGNYGLLDQIAGLKWIQRNIAAFGGDPHRVTIFGESAGGIAASMLAASPLANGLFQGAISESGGSFGPARSDDEGGVNVPTLETAEHNGAAFLAALGASTVAEARKLPAEKILKGPGASMMGGRFWPNFDGYVLPRDQYLLYSVGAQNDTAVLIGTNADEGAIFPHPRDAPSFVKLVRAQYGAYTDKILAAYPAGSDEQAARSASALMRDTAFGWNTWTWARLQSRTGKGRVYIYYFNHRPPYPDVPFFKGVGATHGAELAYVFGNPAEQNMHFTEEDRALSEAVMTYWTDFAKRSDPNGDGVPHWQSFTARHPVVMHFDSTPQMGTVPNLKQLEALDGYYAWRRSQAHERQ
ncbi:MAG TPA: carboxylesterase family protein [Steroidobacteraceae bacterium]